MSVSVLVVHVRNLTDIHQVPIPSDVHPLPEDVTAYVKSFAVLYLHPSLTLYPQFVYPFTLEPHVLTLESSRQSTLQAHVTRNTAYLRSRDDEKLRRQREALRRIAPGFEPSGGTLVPTKLAPRKETSPPLTQSLGSRQFPSSSPPPRDVMNELVDQLVALDSAKSRTS